jgi:hypothetical protein
MAVRVFVVTRTTVIGREQEWVIVGNVGSLQFAAHRTEPLSSVTATSGKRHQWHGLKVFVPIIVVGTGRVHRVVGVWLEFVTSALN